MPGLIGRRSAESGAEGTSAATYCLICVPRYPGTVGKRFLAGHECRAYAPDPFSMSLFRVRGFYDDDRGLAAHLGRFRADLRGGRGWCASPRWPEQLVWCSARRTSMSVDVETACREEADPLLPGNRRLSLWGTPRAKAKRRRRLPAAASKTEASASIPSCVSSRAWLFSMAERVRLIQGDLSLRQPRERARSWRCAFR